MWGKLQELLYLTARIMQWRGIISYCLLAFTFLWVPFFGVICIAQPGGGPSFWQSLLGVTGPYGPLLAAVLTRTLISREGFGDAHLSFRVSRLRYWAYALLLPFFWNSIQDALQVFLGFASVDWSKIPHGLYRVPINLFGGLAIFIGEEFGWRSYLLEKLRPAGRWNALLLSGAIWSLWHAPLVLFPNVHYGSQIDLASGILALLLFLLLGFIFGWLYLQSNSVWPCVLMHSFNNLISLKLFREAWIVSAQPTLLQNSLMAIGPIGLVWLILYSNNQFRAKGESSQNQESLH